MKKKLQIGAAAIALFLTGIAVGQGVSPHRHPNLAAAQRYCQQATGALDRAQSANEFDLDGHAKRAKELLANAYSEIGAAAGAANHH
jgi:hypothetical protein